MFMESGKLWFKRNRILFGIALVVLVLLLVGTSAFGCAQTGAEARGWSGIVVADDTLFLGSMTGKIVALNTASGARVWPQDFALEGQQTTGGFGCAPAAQPVAVYGTPAVAGDLVYFGGYNGVVHAIRADSGVLQWAYPRQGNLEPIVGGPVVSQGKVYIAAADRKDGKILWKLYALDAETGVSQWEFQTEDKIWVTPAVKDGTVYIGSFDNKLYAVNAADGRQKWAPFEVGGAIVTTPLVDGDTVYFGSFDRHLYAVNTADGSLKWKSEFIADKWFWVAPVVSNNKLYAPALDGKVYIVDAQTGRKIAEPDLGAPISSSPVIVGERVVVATETGVLYALDTNSNLASIMATLKTSNDKEEQINAPLAAGDGVIYVHTQTENHETVYALNAETGQTLWSLPLDN